MGDRAAEWTLGFWDGPGPDELAEYFAYAELSGERTGVVVPWRTYLQEKMWLMLADWGYPWRE
jgi:hypothetical protein